MAKIPRPKFNVGDVVTVACNEYPAIPFRAVVSAVWWCDKYSQHEYRVMEDDGTESDGYTEAWFSSDAGMEAQRQKIVDLVSDREEFVTDVDGFVYWWPQVTSRGHHAAHHLRIIADELDLRNEGIQKELDDYFTNHNFNHQHDTKK